MPAHWWVELGLVHLVGRAMSRGVFRGGCGLRSSYQEANGKYTGIKKNCGKAFVI